MKNKCLLCNKEFEVKSNQKKKFCSSNCRTKNSTQNRMVGIEGVDYVKCKICGLKFKEINADHLYLHDINKEEYDKLYGNRISSKTRGRKDTLTKILTPELSKKLSYSHTLGGFIEKYGKSLGAIKYKERNDNMKKCKTLDYYIEKFGNLEGSLKFKNIQLKKAVTLKNFIKKYGKEIGTEKYNNWKIRQKTKNSIKHFIEKYGYDDGVDRWFKKNDKISQANSKIEKCMRKDFEKYCLAVNKFSRLSLQLNKLDNSDLRGIKNGYDLDHQVSKIDGFKNNINPEIIGHISNLIIIPMSENRKKQHNSSIYIEEIILEFKSDTTYQNTINKNTF